MELKDNWDDMINGIWYKSKDIERNMWKIWIGKRKIKRFWSDKIVEFKVDCKWLSKWKVVENNWCNWNNIRCCRWSRLIGKSWYD